MFKGIRILDNELTDALKAKGLGYRQDYVDIYSNSWGPGDTGSEVAEAGVMTEEVLRQGASKVSLLINRPFYRYGGHIELIRFKEYYRMPRGA